MDKIYTNSDLDIQIVDYHNNKALLETGVSFHWWTAHETSMHSHNFYEFFIISDGKTYHELNGEVSVLSKGALCMIRPSDCHQFRTIKDCSCIHMNLCITEQRLESICRSLGISLKELVCTNTLCTDLSVEDFAFFTGRARIPAMLSSQDRMERAAVVCGIIAQAVMLIYQLKLRRDMNCPDWFTALLEKIHLPENLACKAADIYELGGFSPPVMIDYFKRYTGKTVNSYLREMKCSFACSALRETSMTTLEISSMIGYDSLSHFNRIFRQFTGTTPAQYRKQNKPGV